MQRGHGTGKSYAMSKVGRAVTENTVEDSNKANIAVVVERLKIISQRRRVNKTKIFWLHPVQKGCERHIPYNGGQFTTVSFRIRATISSCFFLLYPFYIRPSCLYPCAQYRFWLFGAPNWYDILGTSNVLCLEVIRPISTF